VNDDELTEAIAEALAGTGFYFMPTRGFETGEDVIRERVVPVVRACLMSE
jgi:hypothetical protein